MGVLDTFQLDGKVALVTGGSRGLGLEIAHGLGEAGASVAITARRQEWLAPALQELETAGITARAYTCDVAIDDQVTQLADAVHDQLGPADILVNAAGVSWGASAVEMPL